MLTLPKLAIISILRMHFGFFMWLNSSKIWVDPTSNKWYTHMGGECLILQSAPNFFGNTQRARGRSSAEEQIYLHRLKWNVNVPWPGWMNINFLTRIAVNQVNFEKPIMAFVLCILSRTSWMCTLLAVLARCCCVQRKKNCFCFSLSIIYLIRCCILFVFLSSKIEKQYNML